MPQDQRRRLDSWKEIAEYLGRNVRTVERWAKGRGLPVRRVPGGRSGSVFAYSDELDRWMASGGPRAGDGESEPSPAATPDVAPSSHSVAAPLWSRSRILAIIALVVVSVLGLVAARGAIPRRPAAIASVTVQERDLIALDADGRALWRHTLAGPAKIPAEGTRLTAVEDLDGDGRTEVVAGLMETRSGRDLVDTLNCFSQDGRLLWQLTPDDRVAFGSAEYGSPWNNTELLVFGPASKKKIAWAVHHHTWWPSMLLVIDAAGRRIGRWVHPGWITALNKSEDGRYLFAAGINNEHDATFFAVLDAAHVDGSAPVESFSSPFACERCGTVRPLRYFVMPRPELNRAARFEQGHVHIHVFGTGVEVRVYESPNAVPSGEMIYEFSSDLRPVDASASDSYWEWHRRMTAERSVAHTADECPERSGQTIREWDPGSGWRDLRVPARR